MRTRKIIDYVLYVLAVMFTVWAAIGAVLVDDQLTQIKYLIFVLLGFNTLDGMARIRHQSPGLTASVVLTVPAGSTISGVGPAQSFGQPGTYTLNFQSDPEEKER